MQPLIEHRLELAGFSTRALELEGDGPPIVLLHGFGDSADTWRRVLDRLARADRRTVALDLPGFATAGRLGDGPVFPQWDAFAAAALEYVTDEAGEAAILSGNSLGGAISLRAGERARGLPLAGIVPIAPAGLDMPRWFSIIERDPLVRFVLASPIPLPEPVLRATVGEAYRQLAFARPRAAAPEVVRSFTNHHRSKEQVRGMLEAGRRLLPELTGQCFDLADVECPVLLVWGDRDRMVTHRGARVVTEALPETTYELMEGIGHCPQVEAADRVARLLTEFGDSPSARAA
jgi:pimeloyl-ACP methyl ester carboxylesterase